MVTLTVQSWNQVIGFLERLEVLRKMTNAQRRPLVAPSFSRLDPVFKRKKKW
jgi:predicted transcriptional regulator